MQQKPVIAKGNYKCDACGKIIKKGKKYWLSSFNGVKMKRNHTSCI